MGQVWQEELNEVFRLLRVVVSCSGLEEVLVALGQSGLGCQFGLTSLAIWMMMRESGGEVDVWDGVEGGLSNPRDRWHCCHHGELDAIQSFIPFCDWPKNDEVRQSQHIVPSIDALRPGPSPFWSLRSGVPLWLIIWYCSAAFLAFWIVRIALEILSIVLGLNSDGIWDLQLCRAGSFGHSTALHSQRQ